MLGIHVDDAAWPLVVVSFRGAITDAQFAAYLQALEHNLERSERGQTKIAVLFDAAHGGASSAAQRKAQSDWIALHYQRSAVWCVGYAFAIPSTIVRGMLQAILWFSPMPAPHTVVGTRSEGEAWLRAKLANTSEPPRKILDG